MNFKLENIEVHGFKPAFRGMRQPMKSHSQADSRENPDGSFFIGEKDMELALKLIKGGPSHRKFLRQIMIWVDITACLKWWDEFDTYLHTVKNSTSQMHKLGSTILTEEDFSHPLPDGMLNIINEKILIYQKLKDNAEKSVIENAWREMINVIPQSFVYTRTTMMSYECFLTMYPLRKNHKMEEWQLFCKALRVFLPYMNDFITTIEMNKK